MIKQIAHDQTFDRKRTNACFIFLVGLFVFRVLVCLYSAETACVVNPRVAIRSWKPSCGNQLVATRLPRVAIRLVENRLCELCFVLLLIVPKGVDACT